MRHKLHLLLVAMLACGALSAQQTQPLQLPVLVDGSKTPDKIPDDLAYHHFFLALAVPASPSAEDQARQLAFLAPVKLSPADQENLIGLLATFRTDLDPIEQARAKLLAAAPGAGSAAALADLNTRENDLVTSTLAMVRASLTPDGVSRLDKYIKTHVKKRIVIYGTSR